MQKYIFFNTINNDEIFRVVILCQRKKNAGRNLRLFCIFKTRG